MSDFTFAEICPKEETIILLRDLARMLQTAAYRQKPEMGIGN